MLNAIAAQLPAAVSGAAASGAGVKAAGLVVTKALAVKLVVGVALATGGAVVLADRLAQTPPPAPAVATAVRPVEVRPVEDPTPLPPVPVKIDDPTPKRPPPRVKDSSPELDVDLALERLLLERARQTLLDGDAAGALTVIAQHARLFPEGRLAEEREALGVQTLISAGRFDEARARAAQFEAAYPHSILRPALKAVLDSASLIEKPPSPQ